MLAEISHHSFVNKDNKFHLDNITFGEAPKTNLSFAALENFISKCFMIQSLGGLNGDFTALIVV